MTREGRYWLAAAVWLAAIYLTLGVARSTTEFLRQRNLLRVGVGLAFGIAALLLVLWLLRRRPGPRVYGVLFLAAAILGIALARTSIVEERLHFIQYGVFACLCWGALSKRGFPRRALQAVLLTALAGFLDEIIQGILPSRYFGWNDVLLNAGAGLLAVATLEGLEWARGGAPRPARPLAGE